nr:Zgc:111868 [Danio rerio]
MKGASRSVSSANTKPAIASPMGVIQFTSGQDSNSKHTLSSQSRVDSKLAVSNQYVPVQGIAYSSVVQPQVATIQYAKPSSVNVPVSSEVTMSGLPLSLSQSSLMWQPTKIQGFQSSGTTALQGFLTSGAMQSSSLTPSGFPGSTSPQSQGTSVHVAASPLSVSQSTSGLGSTIQYISSSQGLVDRLLPASSQSVPVQGIAYSSVAQPQSTTGQSAQTSSAKVIVSKAVQSVSPLSINQPSRPQPFVTVSKGLQTSGTVQSGSLTLPSGFSGSTSPKPQGTSGVYTPTAVKEVLMYSQATPSESLSILQPSSSLQSTVLQGSTVSQGFKTPSTDGTFIKLQETSSQYVPTALDVELPLRQSQGSKQEFLISGPATQWRPSSTSWSPDYEASRAVVSQVNASISKLLCR